MQAYRHQQVANLNLPNGSVPSLLVATSQHNQQLQHHQILQRQQSNSAYQDLVKAYLPTMSSNCNGIVSGLTAVSPSMTSFAVRLMSLNAHELRCLSSDSELMRHIDKAQTLIETRLQDINSPEQFNPSDVGANRTQASMQQQQMFATSQLNFAVKHPQNEHLLLASSQDAYYPNFYVQQLTTSNQQQQQQQQQQHQANQLLLIASRYHEQSNLAANGIVGDSTNLSHQQLHNQATSIMPTSALTATTGALAPQQGTTTTTTTTTSTGIHQQAPMQNGLDLRTTPRPASAISTTPSPNRAGSTGSGNSRYNGSQHPKKLKLTEYRRLQQLAEQATAEQRLMRQYQGAGEDASSVRMVGEANENDPRMSNGPPTQAKRTYQNDDLVASVSAVSCQQKADTKLSSCNGTKKYKGEFDEPSLEEVAQRERQLHRPGHYHNVALKNRECACIIGSEFRDKTPIEALEILERWRSLDIDERVKWKWDVNDLPKDIPLSDIKKFEDLRRDYSQGRADFGGASKRKPLSIRGTRQFLLMLYCLHGHPGRDDVMQREGYCPHCFAKIRTENEQSTLVRVVNHFNMKHRRGANPRLSPHLETTPRPGPGAAAESTPVRSPSQVRETLISMVESAVASVETGQDKDKDKDENENEDKDEEKDEAAVGPVQEQRQFKHESDLEKDTSNETAAASRPERTLATVIKTERQIE